MTLKTAAEMTPKAAPQSAPEAAGGTTRAADATMAPGGGAFRKASKPSASERRDQLRGRALAGEAGALTDAALLELLLAYAVRQAKAASLAAALLKRFGDLAQTLTAEASQLESVKGVTPSLLALFAAIRETARRLARGAVGGDKRALEVWPDMIAYCQAAIGRQPTEHLRLLFLDGEGRLIRDETRQKGTVNHAPLYAREIAKIALNVKAASVIIAHNHPSGDPNPSASDIRTTRLLQQALEVVGLKLYDHLIVTASDSFSFLNKGLLEPH